MRYRTKLILTAFAATALFATAVSSATARNLSTNEKNFELIWNGALGGSKTAVQFDVGGRSIDCPVTLLGRFTERTIKKETAINQGTVNHGELEICASGTATIRTETMPWPIRYRGFQGALPRIRSVTIGLIRATFRIRERGGLECEFATEVNNPAVGIAGNSSTVAETGFETTGEPENINLELSSGIPLGGGGFLCAFAGNGTFEGTGLIRNLPRTAKLRITLI